MAYGINIEGTLGVVASFHVIENIQLRDKYQVTWDVLGYKDKSEFEGLKRNATFFQFQMDVDYDDYCKGVSPGQLYVAGKDLIPHNEDTKIFKNATHVE